MKYLFLILIAIVVPAILSAQTFHFLYFSDTNDSEIGKSSEEANRYFLNNFVPQVRKSTGLTIETHLFTGNNFQRNNLNNLLKELSPDDDDVIFFYYTGHGYNNDSNDYPDLTLGLRSDPMPSRRKSLLSVYNVLREKPHRLLVVLAEACNKVYSSALKESYSVSFDALEGSTSNYRTLFQNQTGDYLMSSSKKDEKSSGIEGSLGHFTRAFCNVMDGAKSVSGWRDFLNSVAEKTTSYAEQYSIEEQHPQWISGKYIAGASHVQIAKDPLYLTIDGEGGETSASWSSDSGSETFSVSTNASSYSISLLPSWCHVSEKKSDSFTIRYDANSGHEKREDWFYVKANDNGNAEEKMKVWVTQSAAAKSPSAEIDNVWVIHNQVQYQGMMPVNCMVIHVKFSVDHLKGKNIRVGAFFYYENGTKLMGTYPQYRAFDGQVTVQATSMSDYESCEWEDFTLTLPYAALSMFGSGFISLKFNIVIFGPDKEVLVSSEDVTFQYMQ